MKKDKVKENFDKLFKDTKAIDEKFGIEIHSITLIFEGEEISFEVRLKKGLTHYADLINEDVVYAGDIDALEIFYKKARIYELMEDYEREED